MDAFMKQGNRRYQTSPAVFNRTVNSIYFANLSPNNANLTSFSYVYRYVFVSLTTYTVTVITLTMPSCLSVLLPINRRISPFMF